MERRAETPGQMSVLEVGVRIDAAVPARPLATRLHMGGTARRSLWAHHFATSSFAMTCRQSALPLPEAAAVAASAAICSNYITIGRSVAPVQPARDRIRWLAGVTIL
jgi:hypothetical protein